MSTSKFEPPHPASHDRNLIALLDVAADVMGQEIYRRLEARGLQDIRRWHGCVFRTIEPEGSRLTELAQRANLTKQAVGEAASDLGRLGYLVREPDPHDGRAKILKLTERGILAQREGLEVIAEIERDWEERFGEQRFQDLRAMLEQLVDAA
jgi:DNA-binding MarR family transcriptional regulator